MEVLENRQALGFYRRKLERKAVTIRAKLKITFLFSL